MNEVFCKRLRAKREEAGKTQQEMADILNIKRATYSSYERGKIKPPSDKIERIAKALNVAPQYLLNWETNTEESEEMEAVAKMQKDVREFEDDVEQSVIKRYGEKIKEMRLERKLSLLEVAEDLNFPLSLLKEYESGLKKIPKEALVALSKYFGTDINDLIGIELETDRRHAVITDSETLKNRYAKWQEVIGYNNHFSDAEIDEIISFAKYIQWKRTGLKGGDL